MVHAVACARAARSGQPGRVDSAGRPRARVEPRWPSAWSARACPHDCPDGCAMLVTVDEDGRATHVAGDPDHPITAGFLCGKVSNYLDRVYAEDRAARAPDPRRPQGRGPVPPRELGRGARPGGRAAARGDRRARRRDGAAVLLHGHDGRPPAQLDERALLRRARRQRARAHDLRQRGRSRRAADARRLARGRSRSAGRRRATCCAGAGTRCRPRRTCGGRSSAARRAGARLVVVDPFRSRTARVADEHLRPLPGTDAALGLGMMRAIVDAGLQDEEWCRAHGTGYDELLERLEEYPVERCAELCGVPADDARAGRPRVRHHPAVAAAPRGRRAAPPRRARSPTARSPACRRSPAPGATTGGGCSYIPAATIAAVTAGESGLRRPDLRPGAGAQDQHVAAGTGADRRRPRPAGHRAGVLELQPGGDRARPDAVLAGLRRDDLFTVVLEQFMTDTARHADVVLPTTTQLEHLDAVWSWGHHYVTYNAPAIAPRGAGEAQHGDLPAAGRADGARRPVLPARATRSCSADVLRRRARRRGAGRAGGARLAAGRPRAGGGAARRRRLRHAGRQARASAPTGSRAQGVDPLPFYDPPAEVGRRRARRAATRSP